MATKPFTGEADEISEEADWLPDGFDDAADFHQHILKLRQDALDADRLNRYAALDDLQFVADFNGMQWDEQVRAARQAQGRPCLVTNVLPQFIGQVVGDMTVNKPSIKVRAAEDGDKDIADIREGLIRNIQNWSDAQRIYVRAGTDQVTCGIGNFKVALDYSSREVFDQDIFIREIPNPLAVIWDAQSTEITGKDANYCFVDDLIARREFIKEWPDALISPVGDELPVQDIEGWYSGETVRISEFWQVHEEDAIIALFEDGSTRYLDSIPEQEPVRVRKTKRKFAVMFLISGNAILEGPYRLPIDRVPVFKVTGREVWVSNNRVRYGLTRFIKDQQRLKNYADSQIAEFLSMAPRAQWLADEVAAEGRQEAFRNAHLNGDPLLVYNQGGNIQRVDPPPFPQAFLVWSQAQQQGMKDASGLQDASLGVRSNETSGKAILARQQEGDIATVMYHDNLVASISECGRVVNDLIPYCYDTMRTILIVGPDDAAKVKKINDPNDPDSVNLSVGKYDIWVETGPSYSTKRTQSAEALLQLSRDVPVVGQAAPDLIVKALDIPDNEVIAERLKSMLPPNLQTAGEELTPEQQQQMAQAQQQQQEQEAVQQQMIVLEMASKQAETQFKQAEARRADAQSREAEARANQAEAEANDFLLMANIRKTNAEAAKAEAEAGIAEHEVTIRGHQADQAADKTHIDRADALNRLSPPETPDGEQ